MGGGSSSQKNASQDKNDHIKVIFDKYDTDSSGFIDSGELEAALRDSIEAIEGATPLTEEEFKAITARVMSIADGIKADRDGKLSFREFKNLTQHLGKGSDRTSKIAKLLADPKSRAALRAVPTLDEDKAIAMHKKAMTVAHTVQNDLPKFGCSVEDATAAAICIRIGTIPTAEINATRGGESLTQVDLTPRRKNFFGLTSVSSDIGDTEDIEKKVLRGADNFLCGTLTHLSEHPKEVERFLTPIKMLLGSGVYWGGEEHRDRPLSLLKAPSTAVLANLAKEAEANYLRNGIGDKLGALGKGEGWNMKPLRMDHDRVLGQDLCDAMEDEGAYMIAFLFLNLAVDDDYQALSKAIAEATGGSIKRAPTKGLMRMAGKLEGDHVSEDRPRPACNIDMCRHGVTYKTCESLKAGYNAFTKRFPAARIKNNFSKDFNALEKSFGYRALLVNMHYVPNKNPDGSEQTWKQLFDRPSTQAAWKKRKKHLVSLGCPEKMLGPMLAKLVTTYGPKPVRYIVEVQLMLSEYLAMRKKSHIWYKMLRAEIPQMCFMDFLKYGAQTGKELDNYFAVLFGGKVDSDDKNVTPGGS